MYIGYSVSISSLFVIVVIALLCMNWIITRAYSNAMTRPKAKSPTPASMETKHSASDGLNRGIVPSPLMIGGQNDTDNDIGMDYGSGFHASSDVDVDVVTKG